MAGVCVLLLSLEQHAISSAAASSADLVCETAIQRFSQQTHWLRCQSYSAHASLQQPTVIFLAWCLQAPSEQVLAEGIWLAVWLVNNSMSSHSRDDGCKSDAWACGGKG